MTTPSPDSRDSGHQEPWPLPDLTGLADDDVIDSPDGPVSVGYVRRVWADDFTGGTVYKGGMSDTGPEAMDALLRGGVPEWRRYCQEHGLHPRDGSV